MLFKKIDVKNARKKPTNSSKERKEKNNHFTSVNYFKFLRQIRVRVKNIN